MVNAADITNYNLTRAQAEERLLFWMVVAGKEANMMAHKLDTFLNNLEYTYDGVAVAECDPWMVGYSALLDRSPFELLRRAIERGTLRQHLGRVKMGKYMLLDAGFRKVVDLDALTCTLDELERIPGIGPKTARCFLMHSRPNQRLAGLDTHVLKFLRDVYAIPNVPKVTPTGAAYRRLETEFLKIADQLGLAPADLDLRVWNFFSGRTPTLDYAPRKAAA